MNKPQKFGQGPRKKPESLGRFPPFALIRVFLLAALAVGACVWALVRTFEKRDAPPAPPAAASDAGEDYGLDGWVEIPIETLED